MAQLGKRIRSHVEGREFESPVPTDSLYAKDDNVRGTQR